MRMTRAVALVTAGTLGGCIGTIDTLHYVEGTAPSDRTCEVKVSESRDSYVLAKETVQGTFSVTYMASGPFPSRVNIAAYCGGAKIKELTRIAPRDHDTINLGHLSP